MLAIVVESYYVVLELEKRACEHAEVEFVKEILDLDLWSVIWKRNLSSYF